MTRQSYTPEHKAAALLVLERNHNNFARTSHETGIPQRTLRDWRRISPVDPPPQTAIRRRQSEQPKFSSHNEALRHLRERVMDEALRLMETLEFDTEYLEPHQRATTLNRLLEQVIRLEQYLRTVPDDDDDGTYEMEHPVPMYSERLEELLEKGTEEAQLLREIVAAGNDHDLVVEAVNKVVRARYGPDDEWDGGEDDEDDEEWLKRVRQPGSPDRSAV